MLGQELDPLLEPGLLMLEEVLCPEVTLCFVSVPGCWNTGAARVLEHRGCQGVGIEGLPGKYCDHYLR